MVCVLEMDCPAESSVPEAFEPVQNDAFVPKLLPEIAGKMYVSQTLSSGISFNTGVGGTINVVVAVFDTHPPGLDINENEYDYVICSHVLEHIAYPDKLLTCIKKVLKKDARIILALPNIFHYKSRLELIKGNFRQEESGIWDYTHLRWYSFISAKNLLKHYKFDIELAKVTGRLPAARFFEFILNEKIRKIFFSILTRMSKGLLGDQLLYIGRNIKN